MDTRNLLAQRSRAERPAAHNPALFLFAALLCAAGVAATYWFFVRTTTGQLADESAFKEAELIAPGTERPVIAFLDELPLISVFIAVIVVVFVTILRHRISPAVIALGTFGAANVSSQLLKRTVLDRPDRGVVTLDFNSLPSGHTTLPPPQLRRSSCSPHRAGGHWSHSLAAAMPCSQVPPPSSTSGTGRPTSSPHSSWWQAGRSWAGWS